MMSGLYRPFSLYGDRFDNFALIRFLKSIHVINSLPFHRNGITVQVTIDGPRYTPLGFTLTFEGTGIDLFNPLIG